MPFAIGETFSMVSVDENSLSITDVPSNRIFHGVMSLMVHLNFKNRLVAVAANKHPAVVAALFRYSSFVLLWKITVS